MESVDLLLMCGFALIAMVYASVGFGGGSSYLALLALTALPFQEVKAIALLCNIVVVLGNSIAFLSKRKFNWRKNLPLITLSIPMAYLGARVPMQEKHFFLLLGVSLLLAAMALWAQPASANNENEMLLPPKPLREGAIGGSIGLLSGLVGIGGGIFLSPLLHILRWDTARNIAATASVFILFNSISGLLGLFSGAGPELNTTRLLMLGMAVFWGGQFGLWFSLNKFNPLIIRRITAALVCWAGIQVLIKATS